jgi:hypothetical protein
MSKANDKVALFLGGEAVWITKREEEALFDQGLVVEFGFMGDYELLVAAGHTAEEVEKALNSLRIGE